MLIKGSVNWLYASTWDLNHKGSHCTMYVVRCAVNVMKTGAKKFKIYLWIILDTLNLMNVLKYAK